MCSSHYILPKILPALFYTTLWRNTREQYTPFVLWKTSFSLLITKIIFHKFRPRSFSVFMGSYFLAKFLLLAHVRSHLSNLHQCCHCTIEIPLAGLLKHPVFRHRRTCLSRLPDKQSITTGRLLKTLRIKYHTFRQPDRLF